MNNIFNFFRCISCKEVYQSNHETETNLNLENVSKSKAMNYSKNIFESTTQTNHLPLMNSNLDHEDLEIIEYPDKENLSDNETIFNKQEDIKEESKVEVKVEETKEETENVVIVSSDNVSEEVKKENDVETSTQESPKEEPVVIEVKEEVSSNNKGSKEFLISNDIDVDAGLELLGDMEMYDETLQGFLNETIERIPKMEEYKNSNDMKNYAILAHAMKSDSKYLGFKKLAELSLNHELKGKEDDSNYVKENYDELMAEANRIINIVKEYIG